MEFALVFPAFIVLFLGIIEFGRAMWIQNTLQSAVQQAARCAAVNTATCGTTAAIQSYAASKMVGMTVPSSAFTYTQPSCGKQVSGTIAFSSAAATLLPYAITLRATSCRPS